MRSFDITTVIAWICVCVFLLTAILCVVNLLENCPSRLKMEERWRKRIIPILIVQIVVIAVLMFKNKPDPQPINPEPRGVIAIAQRSQFFWPESFSRQVSDQSLENTKMRIIRNWRNNQDITSADKIDYIWLTLTRDQGSQNASFKPIDLNADLNGFKEIWTIRIDNRTDQSSEPIEVIISQCKDFYIVQGSSQTISDDKLSLGTLGPGAGVTLVAWGKGQTAGADRVKVNAGNTPVELSIVDLGSSDWSRIVALGLQASRSHNAASGEDRKAGQVQ